MAAVVAQRVDGILLVFKITTRARPLAERAREQLADMGANLLGVIVTGGGRGIGAATARLAAEFYGNAKRHARRHGNWRLRGSG